MPQRWIIAYDVADPKRLRRVAKHLEGVGTRLQNSVFECGPQAWQDDKLCEALSGHTEPEHDALSYYPQCTACREKSTWQGKGDIPGEAPSTPAAQRARSLRLSPPAYWLV
ncbi:CRISPR-associated endonuclease Cas2 [Rhodoferax sp.]|uniref:CRISPR-associated endonuclease Cas2 n=1 Tax=Rhodoferax sp. TaxID=50421 RepID=UPI0026323188|nr:CRISPR-associated endonuclease Cas2 [Rhodoferax sp.]MDD2919536.1 CRISPR-associated endonuclease Cas2 [Rhodoferax sp.]